MKALRLIERELSKDQTVFTTRAATLERLLSCEVKLANAIYERPPERIKWCGAGPEPAGGSAYQLRAWFQGRELARETILGVAEELRSVVGYEEGDWSARMMRLSVPWPSPWGFFRGEEASTPTLPTPLGEAGPAANGSTRSGRLK